MLRFRVRGAAVTSRRDPFLAGYTRQEILEHAHKRLDSPDMTSPVPETEEEATGTSTDLALAEVDNAWSPILSGFVGSLFLVIGSLGVGWLAPASELRRVFPDVEDRVDAVVAENGAVLLVDGRSRLLAEVANGLLDSVRTASFRLRMACLVRLENRGETHLPAIGPVDPDMQ